MSQSFRVAWYRYRATFARQLTGYLTVVLLIGLIGGIAVATVAAVAAVISYRHAYELVSTHGGCSTYPIFVSDVFGGY